MSHDVPDLDDWLRENVPGYQFSDPYLASQLRGPGHNAQQAADLARTMGRMELQGQLRGVAPAPAPQTRKRARFPSHQQPIVPDTPQFWGCRHELDNWITSLIKYEKRWGEREEAIPFDPAYLQRHIANANAQPIASRRVPPPPDLALWMPESNPGGLRADMSRRGRRRGGR